MKPTIIRSIETIIGEEETGIEGNGGHSTETGGIDGGTTYIEGAGLG